MEIRKAKDSDIQHIMDFIGIHWRKGHILSENKPFMEWQHKSNEGFNFIVAVSNGLIVAVLGYINNQRYDQNCGLKTIWLALWKVKKDLKVSGLGLKLIKILEAEEQPDILACNGTLSLQWPIYRLLRFKVFSLKCFYLVNSLVPKKIMGSSELEPGNIVNSNSRELSSVMSRVNSNELKDIEWGTYTELNEIVKTPYYFDKRYLRHPVYDYRVYKITGATHLDSLIATRIVKYDDSKVLRIIDFSGDFNSLVGLGAFIREILENEGIEYCDFWQHGIDDKILEDSGFTLLRDDSGVIIPNFFEPFVRETGEIHAVFKSQLSGNYIVCKGDGDQDRPSRLHENV
jgi:hypothetical protein